MSAHLLSIDQGTTSSRAMLFSATGEATFTAQREFRQYFPADGWVEHDPEEIWATTLDVARRAVAHAQSEGLDLAGIGITNQRETTIVWDRDTGKPIYRAIVWQDRRTAPRCEELKAGGLEAKVRAKTGLVLDPYFSATKVAWILDHVDGARQLADAGRLAFGTVDAFLIWRLTGGKEHATDATNASRTLLFNIHTQTWDDELLALLDVPASVLPDVRDSAATFGTSTADVLGLALPIAGVAGDQQAALVGQACFAPGMMKSTYGTGCFVVLNTGNTALESTNQLLSTVGYRLEGVPCYALEGSIFVAGAAVQWLRDGLRMLTSAPETEALAAGLTDNGGVYLVPAFTGLGAPHWDPDARGAIFGLTRDSGIAHFARAALESVCYQTADLLDAMREDGLAPNRVRVDGGMVSNDWLCAFLADILDIAVDRPAHTETTALGAAFLAGLHTGVFDSLEVLSSAWRAEREFLPTMGTTQRASLIRAWKQALARVKTER